ncbi:MAG: tail fiber domain-containing protein [Saprospiraceae bacterium]|nr:tail fiber domain-containing protein [Saprospiraceae bacterium]
MKYKVLFFAIITCLHTSLAQTQIQDADGNTRVQTEALPNEDQIRMSSGGADRLFIGANTAGFTRIDVWNANQCLFIGQGAGANATGSNNTGLGFRAGENITSGFANSFVGQNAGVFTNTGSNNVALGFNAMLLNTSGHSNVAVGTSSLSSLTTGTNNTAIGNSALTSNTASDNTAVGSAALQNTTTGTSNTAVGRKSAQLNNTGSANTAIGQEALRDNTSGANNTSVGFLALAKNTTAGFNVAIGSQALSNNTSGTNLSALGANALFSNTAGSNNTALGRAALSNNALGSSNTALGANAGDLSAGNSNCTFLGFDSDNTLNNNLTNSTAIGNGARLNASNKIRLGNTAVTVIEGQVGFTTSDGRFKNGVKDDAPGLGFVMGLRPVTYHFDYPNYSRFLGENSVDHAVLVQKEQQREMGFVAQDVEDLCRKQGVEVSNLVHSPESEADNYSIAYGQLVVPLVKAVQEQQTQIETLKAEIETLKALLSQVMTQAGATTMDVQVWPNPSRESLHVQMSGITESAVFTLLSADGRVMETRPAAEGLHVVPVKHLVPGNYLIQVMAPGKLPVIKTFVKQ